MSALDGKMQINICRYTIDKFLPAALLVLASAALPAQSLAVERQLELNNMLVQDCGSCHGLTFKGGLGTPLLPEQLKGKPRDYLLNAIMEGRPGTAMPPWKYLLKKEEAEWMLDQLLSSKTP